MNEMVGKRSCGFDFSKLPQIDDMVDGYQIGGRERKHKSPTKRLIDHKDSVTKHKQRIKN